MHVNLVRARREHWLVHKPLVDLQSMTESCQVSEQVVEATKWTARFYGHVTAHMPVPK